ncbi:uncharacterized protein FOMMEDRAFT_19862 [Fomitiporia mediterranea MF3/22]|uniref:uncharacterized protein n=1 Tax=Fomitiporia mediterranea (strain MF3/22) TaxID=694068 RepID=UPI000440830F|nr:uncharacterized protein FOMMEDRAFT_19862 [Fomitiporia mediterranea MF3/22]EJD04648.1 hypothetical protein FOMMEDRAFT_19862 [Fomitiporia mediterranea MF3/22]
MLTKTVLPALVALVCICGASANPQATTVLPFMVTDDSDNGGDPAGSGDAEILSGVIIGTGEGGTTYVLSEASTASDDLPVTVTLVENASQASAIVLLGDSSTTITESIGCGFSGSSAACTVEVVAVTDNQTLTEAFTTSGTADRFTAVVSTSLASQTGGGSGSSSGTGTASGSTPSNTSGAGRNVAGGMLAGVVSMGLAALALA